MKKVLVTGASGFIGNACIDALAESGQYEIHAISLRKHDHVKQGVFWHLLNLHDYQATRELMTQVRPSYLLHLAWHTTPGDFWHSEENYKWLQTSTDLLKTFASAGGKRCVISGSCAEYSTGTGHCLEDVTPLNPATVYGQCKNDLHSMQKVFCTQAGLSCAWGRIFYIYGPHEPRQKLVSSVVLPLLKREPARCSHGMQIRDYMYIEDVASAFVALLGSDVEGAVNIASGQPLALKEIIFKIADKLDGHSLVQFGVRPVVDNEPESLTADINRLSREVGWQPGYSLDEGLDLTIKWWKEQLSKKGLESL